MPSFIHRNEHYHKIQLDDIRYIVPLAKSRLFNFSSLRCRCEILVAEIDMSLSVQKS